MPEPFTTATAAAGAGIASGKLLNVASGFLGALIALGLNEERMPKKRWVSLILFGTVAAYFIPPMVVAWMQYEKLPTWMHSEGAIAWGIGLGCLYITRAMMVLGRRFAKGPVAFVTSRGANSEGDKP